MIQGKATQALILRNDQLNSKNDALILKAS